MKTHLLALVAVTTGLALAQDSKPTADQLAERAWQLLPVYSEEHRYFLSETAARETREAVQLLEEATTLDPDHVRGFSLLGYAHNLLREDLNNRGDVQAASPHYERAVAALTRSLELQPEDPWPPYARGIAHLESGHFAEAIDDLTLAIARADARIHPEGGSVDDEDIRFRALRRRAEALTRAHRFKQAREELTFFHRSFSTHDWPLHRDLAENFAIERDFARSREHFVEAAALFDEDPQAYEWRGYLDGLLGDRASAMKGLERAIALEPIPEVYARLWLWILAGGEERVAAGKDLSELLEGPPPHISEWDLRLGRFMLGAESTSEFIAAGEAEVARRIEANEPLADLRCEVLFYAGLRSQRVAESLADAESAELELRRAMELYRAALKKRPTVWKWEWAYARRYLAQLAEALEEPAECAFTVEGDRFRDLELTGSLSDLRWCEVGASRWREELGREPRVGDLILAIVTTDRGERVPIKRVVGVD